MLNLTFKLEPNETRNHFIWRVYKYQADVGSLTNAECGDICRNELNENYDESAYRKKYEYFISVWNDVSAEYLSDDNISERLSIIEDREAELYKQQVRTRDKLREYRRALTKEARDENLKEIIREEISAIKPFVFSKVDRVGNKSAILKLSDWHIGKLIDNYFNKYNIEVAKKRLTQLVSDTIHYCDIFGVKTLYVCNQGDLLEGVLRSVARVESEENIVSQIMTVSELLSSVLKSFADEGLNVKYISVLDNHSRANVSWKDHIENESYAKLIDWYVEARLGSNIEILQNMIDDNLAIVEIENKKHAFVHGHLKAHALSTIVQNISLPTGIKIDFVHVGHWHSSQQREFAFSKVYVNGSLCGVDEYAFNNGWFAKPSQKLLIVDGNNEIDIDIVLG